MPGTWRAVMAGGIVKAAGERTLLVTIQQSQFVKSPSGFPIREWVDLLPQEYMWRINVQSDERWTAAQTSAYRVFLWQMRYREDMDPDVLNITRDRRLQFQGKTFDIRAANNLAMTAIEIATLSQD